MRFDLDMPAWKWPFYIMAHPFEGFEDLRWKKAYNMKHIFLTRSKKQNHFTANISQTVLAFLTLKTYRFKF